MTGTSSWMPCTLCKSHQSMANHCSAYTFQRSSQKSHNPVHHGIYCIGQSLGNVCSQTRCRWRRSALPPAAISIGGHWWHPLSPYSGRETCSPPPPRRSGNESSLLHLRSGDSSRVCPSAAGLLCDALMALACSCCTPVVVTFCPVMQWRWWPRLGAHPRPDRSADPSGPVAPLLLTASHHQDLSAAPLWTELLEASAPLSWRIPYLPPEEHVLLAVLCVHLKLSLVVEPHWWCWERMQWYLWRSPLCAEPFKLCSFLSFGFRPAWEIQLQPPFTLVLTYTVGAQSIARLCQNLVNYRGNLSAHRRRRKLRFFLFDRSSLRVN